MVRCDPNCWACAALEEAFKEKRHCLKCAIMRLRQLGYSCRQVSFMLHTSRRVIAKVERGEQIVNRILDFGRLATPT